jgi:hypothetical protein
MRFNDARDFNSQSSSHFALTGNSFGAHPLSGIVRCGSTVEGKLPMSRFRVVYSRGSFGFVTLCDTRDQALTKADALYRTLGVWHVHVEDVAGNRIASAYDLQFGRPDARLPREFPAGRLGGDAGGICQ